MNNGISQFIACLFASCLPLAVKAAGLVPCDDDCNLCYLLVGIQNIFEFLMKILAPLALAALAAVGVTFIVSTGNVKLVEFAKKTLNYSLKGFAIALLAWLGVNSIMDLMGYQHPQGGKWYEHQCAVVSKPPGSGENCVTKEIQSIIVQCKPEKGKSGYEETNLITLDTYPGTKKPDKYQLKAIGKFKCAKEDGSSEEIEEEITQKADWKSSDETLVKIDKGMTQAIKPGSSLPYVEASYKDKKSNQVKVYINACPLLARGEQSQKKLSESNSPKFSDFINECLGIKTVKAGPKSTNCDVCPSDQRITCHFVYGNPNADFIFILAMGNVDECFTGELYEGEMKYWDHEKDREEFIKIAEKLAIGITYAPDVPGVCGKNECFAVYRTEDKTIDAFGEQDDSCPSRKFVSYGYICNGRIRPYYNFTKESALYSIDDASNVLAHEQIGHGFARLDDEYIECDKDPNDYLGLPHYNCTMTRSGPPRPPNKWGVHHAWRGCLYTTYLGRFSVNSIMKGTFPMSKFDYVSNEVIRYTVKHWPSGGPPEWAEYWEKVQRCDGY